MTKPFKGVIKNWHRDGDVIVGECEYHPNAVPLSPDAVLHNGIVAGCRMHTSRVEKIEDRGGFSICETKNSFYVLNGSSDRGGD